MNSYSPPFQITSTALNLVAEISEYVGKIEPKSIPLHLRKENAIRSIHSSLAIENNTLSLEQVSRIIDGKKVVALEREIAEVKNASKCYGLIGELSPYEEIDLLKAHSVMMNGLVPEAGNFRNKGVGVFKGNEVVHMAPPAERVSSLISRLLSWLKNTDIHPLISSSIFHYEFEFIHPFTDGNGRIGRLWQTLILSKWNSSLAYLPVESVIKENQTEYYQMLSQSDSDASSTIFIEFMLMAISKAVKSIPVSNGVSSKDNANIGKLLSFMSDKPMSLLEIMSKLKLTHRTNFRKNYLNPAIKCGFVKLSNPDSPNSPSQTYYKV